MIPLIHGYWMQCPAGMDPATLEPWELALTIQPILGPGVVVSHVSAARIWGIPLSENMTWVDHLLGEPPAFPRADHRPHLAFQGSRRNQSTRKFVMHRGVQLGPLLGPWEVPVMHPVETVVVLHHLLPGWRSVVALVHLLATGLSYCAGTEPVSAQEIAYHLSELRPGTRGLARIRAALPLAAPNVWSPMETVLRLALVSQGITTPQTNARVDLAGGRTAFIDLAWPENMVGVEYNGAIHYQDRHTYGDEMYRLNRLQDLGWRIRPVVAEDLRDARRFRELVRWVKKTLEAT